jgi:hypothetical protein
VILRVLPAVPNHGAADAAYGRTYATPTPFDLLGKWNLVLYLNGAAMARTSIPGNHP